MTHSVRHTVHAVCRVCIARACVCVCVCVGVSCIGVSLCTNFLNTFHSVHGLDSMRHGVHGRCVGVRTANKLPSAWVWLADGATALHVAVSLQDRRLVERLLALGADPMAVDDQGWTPLFAAAYHGHAHTDVSHILLAEKPAQEPVIVQSGKLSWSLLSDDLPRDK